MQQQHLATM
uniref:Protein LAZ1 homolog 1-like n=1 Tax=Rhizophora mucronata TaxID=61149 RepID=A0A2P2LES2_RHIMU